MKVAFSLLLPSVFLSAYANTYSISDTVVPSSFLSFFNFEAIPDPTQGRVNYVDGPTAVSQRLVEEVSSTSFVIRADATTILDPDGPGRNSVRLKSKNSYTTHVAVFDVNHMPQGCGTWPAIWEKGPNWPNGGEIDIVEGVNDQPPNIATLHTSPGCTMPSWRDQTGTTTESNCDATVNANLGCGVHFPTANSYGPPFNNNGGGWYAVERSESGVNVFFWPRNSPLVPGDIKGGNSVNPSEWGTPAANFPSTSCDMDSHFTNHNIIINLTFCGYWAGSVYNQTSCPSTCVDFVNNNPEAFRRAYFDFASIHIYE